jgi:hypothetical protein
MAGKVETVISVHCMDCGRSGHHAKDCPPKATEVTEELLRTKKMSGAERAAHPMCTSGMLTRHSGSWTTDCGENCDCSDPGRGGCYCCWCSSNSYPDLKAHWSCCGCEDRHQPYCLRNHLFSSDQLKRVANCASATVHLGGLMSVAAPLSVFVSADRGQLGGRNPGSPGPQGCQGTIRCRTALSALIVYVCARMQYTPNMRRATRKIRDATDPMQRVT